MPSLINNKRLIFLLTTNYYLQCYQFKWFLIHFFLEKTILIIFDNKTILFVFTNKIYTVVYINIYIYNIGRNIRNENNEVYKKWYKHDFYNFLLN